MWRKVDIPDKNIHLNPHYKVEMSGVAIWTISSSVLDVARCRLTVVSLVSEPSPVFPEAWLLIGLKLSSNSSNFLRNVPTTRVRIEPLSSRTIIRFLHAYFGLKYRAQRTEHNSDTLFESFLGTTLFKSASH